MDAIRRGIEIRDGFEMGGQLTRQECMDVRVNLRQGDRPVAAGRAPGSPGLAVGPSAGSASGEQDCRKPDRTRRMDMHRRHPTAT